MTLPTAALPTFDYLGVAPPNPKEVQTENIAKTWISSFASAVSARDIQGILDTLHDKPWWRDLFALTWDMRSFFGKDKISQFLKDRLSDTNFSKITFAGAQYSQPWNDVAWIGIRFTFETDVASGRGVVYLVPTPTSDWKAMIVTTTLDSLKGFPELIGSLRNPAPSHGKWVQQREREQEFSDADPEVLIIGGGQSGLDVAVRLKALGTTNLIVEQNARVGDQWRNRYDALCLHDPVWYDHLPYLPFPPNWPVYTPALKIADWLESYAHSMELNVWTSSTVVNVSRAKNNISTKTGKLQWDVLVKRADGTERVLHVDHVVFALGFGANLPSVPEIPRKEEFQGQVLHSSSHRSAKDHIGKKVIVVGACTSAHDIASDYADHGVDVTMFQRSSTYVMSVKNGMPRIFKPMYWEGGPPTEIADLLANSMPLPFTKLIAQRRVKEIKEADKEMLEGLENAGYKLNDGIDGGGHVTLLVERAGGYYFDVGSCQKIIDGKIRMKSGTEIESFTPRGLRFKDGSELEADVILFATGFGDARAALLSILGADYSDKLGPLWSLSGDGEFRTLWREIGSGPETENLWYMFGNFAWCRFYSKLLALQIKAKQEGKFTTRYSVSESSN